MEAISINKGKPPRGRGRRQRNGETLREKKKVPLMNKNRRKTERSSRIRGNKVSAGEKGKVTATVGNGIAMKDARGFGNRNTEDWGKSLERGKEMRGKGRI